MPINGADAAGPLAGASAPSPLPLVVAMSGSESFEATHALPVGDGRVVGRELDARVVEVVLDDLVAERLARHGGLREQVGGLSQGRRHACDVALVGVPDEQVLGLELLLDAVQAGG